MNLIKLNTFSRRAFLGTLVFASGFYLLTPSQGAPEQKNIKLQPELEVAPPTVETQNGKAYVVKFKDGREAELKVTSITSRLVNTSMKIVDNTCANRQNIICNYQFHFRFFWISLIWTKHPDSTKIGQIVSRGTKLKVQTEEEFKDSFFKLDSESVFVSNMNPQANLKITQGLPAHQLKCQDFSWLPDGKKEAPLKLHISRWGAEENLPNYETDQNENRTFGGIYGMDLIRSDMDTLKINSIANYHGIFEFANILSITPTVSVSTYTKTGDSCQIGVATDIQNDLFVYFGELQSNRPKVELASTYTIGSDEILQDTYVKSQMENWFKEDSPDSLGMVYR